MKPIKLTYTVAALAFTVILGASSARAVTPGSPGDLILGFEEPGAGGSSNVYEVDLGAASQFLNAAPSSTITFDLSTSDLSNATNGFGSSWASSTLLQYGVIGGTQSIGGDITVGGDTLAENTLFTTVNTWAAVPTEKTTAQQATAQSYISAVYNDVANVGTPSAGSTSSLPAVYTSASDSGSYAKEVTKNNFNFGTGNAKSSLDFNSDGSTPVVDTALLDLYEVTPTNADTGSKPTDLLGTFGLASNGDLTFTAEAVPEPSTWSLIGLGGLVMIWNLRRRNHRSSTV